MTFLTGLICSKASATATKSGDGAFSARSTEGAVAITHV